MNRFERNIGFKGEAKLKYLDGEVQVVTPGDFVRCAVTGAPFRSTSCAIGASSCKRPMPTPRPR